MATGALVATGIPARATTTALIIVAVIVVPFGVHLGSVRSATSAAGIAVGSGLRGRTRWIAREQIGDCRTVPISWPQVYGFGLPQAWRQTRMTVHAGPTLWLWLRSGEQVWISVTDAGLAADVLTDRTATPPTPDTGNDEGRRTA